MPEEKIESVSIIIRCFNEEKHIENLLKAIQVQVYQNYEIIIVDSGSTDRTLDIVKKYPVKVINIKPEDFTFGYSLNMGCKAANGEYLVFASAHVIPVESNWLNEILKPFGNPLVDLVYGKQIGNHLNKYSEHQVFAQQFPAQSNFEQTIPFCNNANCAIRRSTWVRHPYDEALTGLEDLEMGKQLIKEGKLIAYTADAIIYHIHEETPQKIFSRYKREAIALKRIFPDTHLSFIEFLYFLVSNMLMDILRSIKHHKFFHNITEILVFRTMQYFGTYSGIKDRSKVTHEMITRFYYPRKFQFGIFKRKTL